MKHSAYIWREFQGNFYFWKPTLNQDFSISLAFPKKEESNSPWWIFPYQVSIQRLPRPSRSMKFGDVKSPNSEEETTRSERVTQKAWAAGNNTTRPWDSARFSPPENSIFRTDTKIWLYCSPRLYLPF